MDAKSVEMELATAREHVRLAVLSLTKIVTYDGDIGLSEPEIANVADILRAAVECYSDLRGV